MERLETRAMFSGVRFTQHEIPGLDETHTVVALADVDGDGNNNELLVSVRTVSDVPGWEVLEWDVLDGARRNLFADFFPTQFGDYDKDGLLDLVGFSVGVDGGVSLGRGLADGRFELFELSVNEVDRVTLIWSNLVFVDLDKDGDDDMVVAVREEERVELPKSRRVLYVGEQVSPWEFDFSEVGELGFDGTVDYGIAVGDLNGDAELDVVVADVGDHIGEVLAFTSVEADGWYDERWVLWDGPRAAASWRPYITDVDANGTEDVVIEGLGYGWSAVIRNDGDGFLASEGRQDWGSARGIFDVDLDGDLDLVTNQDGKGRWVENVDGLGVGSILHEVGGTSRDVEWLFGDVDGDGDVDAVSQKWWYESNATALRSDLDADGIVGFSDFLVFSSNYGRGDDGVTQRDGDINADGLIDFDDFLIFSATYGDEV